MAMLLEALGESLALSCRKRTGTVLTEVQLYTHPTARIRQFSYRGVRPLIAPAPFTLSGQVIAPGEAELWAGNGDGAAQVARLRFE